MPPTGVQPAQHPQKAPTIAERLGFQTTEWADLFKVTWNFLESIAE